MWFVMEINSQKSKKTVYYSGFTVVLITALVGAYVLFYITDLKPVRLFHTTKYLLTQEMGMSFYNAPDGEDGGTILERVSYDLPSIRFRCAGRTSLQWWKRAPWPVCLQGLE